MAWTSATWTGSRVEAGNRVKRELERVPGASVSVSGAPPYVSIK